MRMLFAGVCLVVTLSIVANSNAFSASQDKGDPKYTIKEVMEEGQSKGGLFGKVLSGKASDAEAKTLLEMYQALAQQKPPAGDAESWKKKTDALVEGAKLYVDGKKADGKSKLGMAGNCKGCHTLHKGA